MILYLCHACKLALRVMESQASDAMIVGPSSSFWHATIECPRCDQRGMRSALESQVDLSGAHIFDLSPEECFRVLCGDGLPEQRMFTPDDVTQLLTTHRVTGVVASHVPATGLVSIEKLVLSGGQRMYLAASPAGAVVYRIADRTPDE